MLLIFVGFIETRYFTCLASVHTVFMQLRQHSIKNVYLSSV